MEVRPIRQMAEGEGRILTRVSALMWLVTLAALACGGAGGGGHRRHDGARTRRSEIGLMKALGAPRMMVGAFFLGEQWLLAFLGGAAGYAWGWDCARLLGERVFGVSPEMRWILLPDRAGCGGGGGHCWGVSCRLRRVMRLDPAPVLRGE